jgi:glycosyltransferase involved in cell wall biosynthesis
MTPQVSVVMPVRNGARWLGEAVASIIAQSRLDWELIAIDDGSTDDTPRILDDCVKRDGRIRVIRQEPLGLVSALNRGLAEVRGRLLARLDADDRALPERLDRQVHHLAAHPEIGLLGTWAQEIDEYGNRRGQLRPASQPDELGRILLDANPLIHSSVMFRTDLARRVGGFRPAFQAAEDYDLWLRLAENAKVANLPEILVEYRWHGGNVTSHNAIRQAFSVRLAQRSARARRQSGRDPAGSLAIPPDWRAPIADASFYADDAKLYRLLDLADPDVASGAADAVDFALLEARFAELNHAERALAAQAMINQMVRADRARARVTRRMFFRLLRRRPGMIPPAAWRSLPAALLR